MYHFHRQNFENSGFAKKVPFFAPILCALFILRTSLKTVVAVPDILDPRRGRSYKMPTVCEYVCEYVCMYVTAAQP